MTDLFRKYIERGPIGEVELPKAAEVQEATDSMVRLDSGEWVHHTEAVKLPAGGGRMRWERL